MTAPSVHAEDSLKIHIIQLTELKGKRDTSTITVRYFRTPVSGMGNASRQEISKDRNT